MSALRTNPAEFVAPQAVNAIQQRSLGVGLLFGVASLILALIPLLLLVRQTKGAAGAQHIME